ncbi:MAG: glycerophosphodiester phosphodiesterase [Candidatus Heimdallarchaeota archaeon]|nr:MAG: glycerophosphodiester phosphodiesterase [Candidatus Heimdallarchaeota archaeon]
MKYIKILAHRGYLINEEPGNSIPAFQTAVQHRADGLEFDVHLTADNRLICFHDDTLERELARSDAIKDLSYKELTSIELSEGITIPSLEEVFDLFGNKVTLNIELKSQKKGEKELVEMIHQFNLTDDLTKLIVSSFFYTPLKKIKTIDPEIPTGLLCQSSKNQVQVARKLNCNAIHPYYDIIPSNWVKFHSPRLTTVFHNFYFHRSIKKAQKLGLFVTPWTVNSEKYLKAAIQRQVDNIITDNVEIALELRDQCLYNKNDISPDLF